MITEQREAGRTARPLPVVLGAAGLALAPTGGIMAGFRAGEGGSVGWWVWLLAASGVAAASGAIALARRDRLAGGSGRGSGLGIAALMLAALGPVFWLLVQIAPSVEELEGSLLGPVGFAVAFLVGMISFFSPCILPLLPGYLTFVSGLSGEEIERGSARRRVLAGTSLFTLGFATVFTALGAAASFIGSFFIENLAGINRIAGVIVIVMGVAFMLPQVMSFLEIERRPLMRYARPGVGGAYPLGLAFGVGWTPCVGPGLGIMLSLGLADGSVGRGALLLFFFSLGFGVWFVLAGLGVRRALGASAWLRRRARALQAVGGVFMVALGVLLVTDLWNSLLNPLRRLITEFAPPV